MVLVTGTVIAAVRLAYTKTRLLKYLLAALVLAPLLALALFPQYPVQFEKRLSGALAVQQSSADERADNLNRMLILAAGGYSDEINEYFKNHPLREKFFYLLLILLFAGAMFFAKKKKTVSSWFPAVFLMAGVSGFIAAYQARLMPAWSIGGYYLAFLYPTFALSLPPLFARGKARQVAAVFMIAYALVLFAGSFEQINQLDKNDALLNYHRYKRVVVNSSPRGHLFRLVYYLPDDSFLYVDGVDGLIEKPERWAPVLESGDAIIFIAIDKKLRVEENRLIQVFKDYTGKKVHFVKGYYDNFHPYQVE